MAKKIRIVKASSPTFWYADKIGEVFEVVREHADDYIVERNGSTYFIYVEKQDCEEVIEHNSQLYRKVDRSVREGDTVLITKFDNDSVYVITTVEDIDYDADTASIEASICGAGYLDIGEGDDWDEYFVLETIDQPVQPSTPPYAEVSELLHEASRQTRIDKAFEKVVARNGAALKRLSEPDFGPEPAKDKFDGLPTVPELIANLAQEVAKEKKLRQELAAAVSDLEDDIVDLEDRLDENEKDTEEVIGRINDLGAGTEAAAVDFDKLISELTTRRDKAKASFDDSSRRGDAVGTAYYDGLYIGYRNSIGRLERMLRNA